MASFSNRPLDWNSESRRMVREASGLSFGENWNNEVEARFAAKFELRRVLLEHKGCLAMQQHVGREWEPPSLFCPACHETITPAMGPRTCPSIMAEVNECMAMGCTLAEVGMVWRQVVGILEEAWEEELHRCHQ